MAESSKEATARAEGRLQAVAKKKAAADSRNDERLAAEHVRDDKTAKLKAQRLGKNQADAEATAAAHRATAEALKRTRPRAEPPRGIIQVAEAEMPTSDPIGIGPSGTRRSLVAEALIGKRS
jgi:septal ring factor EnvC (AmiA/AmiB activator)